MKSVVICGSRRFKPEARAFEAELRNLGVVVYSPHFHSGEKEWEKLDEAYKNFVAIGLTHDHFYKIRMADVVYVFNKDGYVGASTTMEIGYAAALDKPIYVLSGEDPERARRILYREVISTPEELAKRLV